MTTPVTKPTLQRLRELILKSEGKTSEEELIRGCYFKHSDDPSEFQPKDYLLVADCCPFQGKHHKLLNATCISPEEYAGWEFQLRTKEIEKIEILGLPITLSRILMALGKKSNSLPHKPCTLFANADLNNENCSIASPWGCANWILPSDADGQSEETILKLIEILTERK